MRLRKTRITKPDGRYLWYYSWSGPTPSVEPTAASPALESEGLELDVVEAFDDKVVGRYNHETGLSGKMHVCRAADGLRVWSVDR